MDTSRQEIESSISLTQFILAEGRKHPDATGTLSILLHAIEIASKYTSSRVRAAGSEGSTNVQGETVKKLDVIANEAFITALKRSHTVSLMVSEENEDVIIVDKSSGQYVATFDPLDGSSNIDVNVSIGTIFESPTVSDVLKPGNQLVAAGYTMYGSATIMVLTTGNGVNAFTLDPSSGEFVLSHPKIQTPKMKRIYSINEGYYKFWDEKLRKYIDRIKSPEDDKSIYSQRYVGSMVADVHRTLLYGGIFLYPSDSRSPQGKLRLLYEANPMAMIMEQAGGKASTGKERILDVVPTSIHQRVPVFLGSVQNVDELLAALE